MSAINVIGLFIIFLSIYLFRIGIMDLDSYAPGTKIPNIKTIGGSIMMFIAGITLTVTSKSACELFKIFCGG